MNPVHGLHPIKLNKKIVFRCGVVMAFHPSWLLSVDSDGEQSPGWWTALQMGPRRLRKLCRIRIHTLIKKRNISNAWHLIRYQSVYFKTKVLNSAVGRLTESSTGSTENLSREPFYFPQPTKLQFRTKLFKGSLVKTNCPNQTVSVFTWCKKKKKESLSFYMFDSYYATVPALGSGYYLLFCILWHWEWLDVISGKK